MPRRRPVSLGHPARYVAGAFAVAIVIGTVLLRLPVSGRGGRAVGWLDAWFTSTSAVCVTGLAVVDTGQAWSWFGLAVITALVQVGGIGIMTMASLVALLVSRRLGMRARRLTQTETGAIPSGELRQVLFAVIVLSLAVEIVVAAALAFRLTTAYDKEPVVAISSGVFHSVMAFNNAGFGLRADSLMAYVTDVWVNVPVMVAVVLGGLGFPVLVELWRRRQEGGPTGRRLAHLPTLPLPRWNPVVAMWASGPPAGGPAVGDDTTGNGAPRPLVRTRVSLHTRLTLAVTLILLVIGTLAMLALEWDNPATLGPLGAGDKLLASTFQSVSSRTAGFNTIDIGAMNNTTWLAFDVLMFIGSGAASTGGGIKVTTFGVLVLACVAEARGERNVTFSGRRLSAAVVRQALAITVVGGLVVGGVVTLLEARNPISLDQALFEAVSAFGTVGMSTGITASLDTLSQTAIIVLMFFGRVGTATLGAALVLRARDRLYEYPEERPLVG
jgi:Trk-type K+ transport system membrane component